MSVSNALGITPHTKYQNTYVHAKTIYLPGNK